MSTALRLRHQFARAKQDLEEYRLVESQQTPLGGWNLASAPEPSRGVPPHALAAGLPSLPEAAETPRAEVQDLSLLDHEPSYSPQHIEDAMMSSHEEDADIYRFLLETGATSLVVLDPTVLTRLIRRPQRVLQDTGLHTLYLIGCTDRDQHQRCLGEASKLFKLDRLRLFARSAGANEFATVCASDDRSPPSQRLVVAPFLLGRMSSEQRRSFLEGAQSACAHLLILDYAKNRDALLSDLDASDFTFDSRSLSEGRGKSLLDPSTKTFRVLCKGKPVDPKTDARSSSTGKKI